MKFNSREMKKMKKQLNQLSKVGKRLFKKHQYGVLFSAMTFITVMVGVNEYMLRQNSQFLAEFDAAPVAESVQFASEKAPKEERSLAGKNSKSPRR